MARWRWRVRIHTFAIILGIVALIVSPAIPSAVSATIPTSTGVPPAASPAVPAPPARGTTAATPTPAPASPLPFAPPPTGSGSAPTGGRPPARSGPGAIALAIDAVATAPTGVLTVDSTLRNTRSDPVTVDLGCSHVPVIYLRTTSTSTVSKPLVLPPSGPGEANRCLTSDVLLPPGAAHAFRYSYSLATTPTGVYTLQEHLSYTVQVAAPATRYRTLSDGSIVDTFPTKPVTAVATNVRVSTGAPSAGPALLAYPHSSLFGPFSPRVLVFTYATSATASNSDALTQQLSAAFATGSKYHNESASQANFSVWQTAVETALPPTAAPGIGDYQAVFAKYDICTLAREHQVNFVWLWLDNPGPAGFTEWVTTGPEFQQKYGFNVPTCDTTVTTLGLNYNRLMPEALHSHGHFIENLLQYAFGPGDYADGAGTDTYDRFDGQLYRYNHSNTAWNDPLNTISAHCGDVHFPPNATTDYDYGNTGVVLSDCATYNPGNPAAERYVPISASTWQSLPCDPAIRDRGDAFDCNEQSYLMWWMQNMPGYNNGVLDLDGLAMPNWWQYILATDTTVPLPPPAIAALQPSSGPTSQASAVAVSGTGFVNGATVSFGGISATSATFGSSISLSAVPPDHAAGTVDVVITNPDGQSATLPGGYTYVAPLPDLAPYTRPGYAAPVVPSSVQGAATTGTLYAGQPTAIDWSFANLGAADITTSFVVELWIDTTRYIRYPAAGMPASSSLSFDDWSITVPTPGSHIVRLVVDADDTVTESDETNNSWQGEFTWIALPLPDLVLTSAPGYAVPVVVASAPGAHSSDTLSAGQTAYVSLAIMNVGDGDAGAFAVEVWVDGTRYLRERYLGLPSQSSVALIDRPIGVASAGGHTVKVIVDADNIVAESDETNNGWQGQFTWTVTLPGALPTQRPGTPVPGVAGPVPGTRPGTPTPAGSTPRPLPTAR